MTHYRCKKHNITHKQTNKVLQLLGNGETSECESIDDENDIVDNLETIRMNLCVGANVEVEEEFNDPASEDNEGVSSHSDQSSDETDELSESPPSSLKYNVTPKKNIKWQKRQLNVPVDDLWTTEADSIHNVLAPIDYFQHYIPNSLFELMANKTNLYAVQKDKTRFKPTNAHEIQTLVALHIATGVFGFPHVKMFWNDTVGINCFVDNMTRDRFFEL